MHATSMHLKTSMYTSMHFHAYHATIHMHHASHPSKTGASLHSIHLTKEVIELLHVFNNLINYYLLKCISHSKLLHIPIMYLHGRKNHMEDISKYPLSLTLSLIEGSVFHHPLLVSEVNMLSSPQRLRWDVIHLLLSRYVL